jgi:SNF2 family DNA or RNA helicase
MCDSWLRKREINPLTNRPIKVGSEMYRDIENFCKNEDENCIQIRNNRNINPITKKTLTQTSKKADLFLGLCDKAKKASSRKASSRKASSRKASSRKASSRKASSRKASSRKASSRKASSRKASSRKASSRKASSRKASSKKASSKKASSRKASSRKASSRKASSKKASSRKKGSKKVGSKKTASKKTGSKKTGSKKVSSKKVSSKIINNLIQNIDKKEEEKQSIEIAENVKDVEVIENFQSISPLQCTKYKTVKLKDHQLKICKFIDKNPLAKGMIVFHSVGSGKTITAITIIRCLLKHFPTKKVFVVTPKSLVTNFQKEVLKLEIDFNDNVEVITHVRFVNKIDEDLEKYGKVNFCKNSIIIIDEAHNFKGEHILSKKTGKYRGLRAHSLLQATKVASHVFPLTATPLINSPRDFANLFCMVYGNEDKVGEYADTFEGITKLKQYEILSQQSYLKQLLENKISYFKNNDTTDYPSVTYHKMDFVMTPQYYQLYEKIELGKTGEDFINPLFAAEESDSRLRVLHNGIRRAVNSIDESIPTPKVEWIMNKIREDIANNKKVLLFSNWLVSGSNLVQKLLKKEGIPYQEIKGDLSIPKRNKAVKEYNSGKIKVLCISSAGGEGLDLKETRTVIIMEPHWNNEKLNQVIGRAVRYKSHSELPAEERHVDIYKLYLHTPVSQSIDEVLYIMSREKDKKIQKFYDIILSFSL